MLPPWRAWGRAFRGALVYPLRPVGILFILLSAFIWSAGECGSFYYARVVTLPMVSFYVAFVYTYIINIMRSSAVGSSAPPPFVWNQDMVDDIVRPLGRLVVVLFFCYLPVLVGILWEGDLFKVFLLITIPAHVDLEPYQEVIKMLGSFYFPMAILAVTANEDLLAVSPHFVLPAILRVPLQYMVVAGTFMWVNGLHNNLLRHTGEAGWIEAGIAQFFVKVGLLYVYCVLARVLGMTHWIYRKRLGWFERV